MSEQDPKADVPAEGVNASAELTKSPAQHPAAKSMIRAIRQEILIWRKVQLKERTGLSERTIANVDDLEWVSEHTCRLYLREINNGLANAQQKGQLSFPFVELELRDLFETAFRNNQQVWRAVPAPPEGELRTKMVKAFLRDIAEKRRA